MKYRTQKTKYKGEGNPNFNKGNTHNNKCIDCGTHITKNSTRCKSCANKGKLSSNYKGGKPKCEICNKSLSAYNVKRCLKCEYDRRIQEEIFKGINNPSYVHGNGYSLYPSEFTRKLKESIRKRDNHICQICNKQQKQKKLDVHHIDYNKENCQESNLITLCRRCNLKVNFNRNYWTELLKDKVTSMEKLNKVGLIK
jgi:5-methylcytosine-specific restriction endonuclease McrA